VFGLGALLAVILTGQPPYVGDSFESVRVQAARGKLDDCFARLDATGAEPEVVDMGPDSEKKGWAHPFPASGSPEWKSFTKPTYQGTVPFLQGDSPFFSGRSYGLGRKTNSTPIKKAGVGKVPTPAAVYHLLSGA
jgi:hypothetical protein